jgi:hypothetical protein
MITRIIQMQAGADHGHLTLAELTDFVASAQAAEIPAATMLRVRTKGLGGLLARIETAGLPR